MYDISLHLLDLLENSVNAGARRIDITVDEQPSRDSLSISVDDDGRGFSCPPEKVLDPYYTTKEGRRVGLGLSLMGDAAGLAGGRLSVGSSSLGGASVHTDMRLGHVDRNPLGDIASAVSSIVCTTPGLDVRCRLVVGDREVEIDSLDARRECPATARSDLAVARKVSWKIVAAMRALGMSA